MRINKSELSKKIGQLKGIVPSRTTIEALKGVLCSDGYLIASDPISRCLECILSV